MDKEVRKGVQRFRSRRIAQSIYLERLWKFMRKKVIDTTYYSTKEKFLEGIMNFFKNIGNYRTELESLLTLNFHIP